MCVFPRTFAPMWDVFRVSSDKLALCHLELMRKMNDLIREINKYGDEQVKIHRRVRTRRDARRCLAYTSWLEYFPTTRPTLSFCHPYLIYLPQNPITVLSFPGNRCGLSIK